MSDDWSFREAQRQQEEMHRQAQEAADRAAREAAEREAAERARRQGDTSGCMVLFALMLCIIGVAAGVTWMM